MAFIKQEALEKAREIKVKADEDFSIEKVSAVTKAKAPRTADRSRVPGQDRTAGDVKHRCDVREEEEAGRSPKAHVRAFWSWPRPWADVQRSLSARSNQTNKARLEQLRVREELLESVFETARKGLSDLTKDEGKYAEVLEKLTLQVRQAA